MITLALIGILVGILSSISGLGGGFMIVPLLIFLGREAKLAVVTSFVFILVVAISSIIAHYRLGNGDIKTGLMLGLGGVIGAQIGVKIGSQLKAEYLRGILAILVLLVCAKILTDLILTPSDVCTTSIF